VLTIVDVFYRFLSKYWPGVFGNKKEKMDCPIPFITLTDEAQKSKKEGKEDPKRKFIVNEEACKLIQKIKNKITVIAIAGLYRTGKSFILNRLAGSTIGFDIGSTIEPCTQGIWMWIVDPKKAQNPAFPKDSTVILLDTEGLGSYTKSKTYDIQIFSLAVLLSSYFIYNSTGSIDETALDRLSLVVELSKHIKAQSDQDVEAPSDLNMFFPKFMWLVRDFSLKLQSNGKDISAKEYLENSLAPIQGDQSKIKEKNLIRASITQFFVDRACFTLKRPVNDEKLLQHLEQATEADFRPQFLEELDEFMTTIFSNSKPKRLYKENLNGPMFIQLVKNYVEAINSGTIPVIKTAWENVVEVENQKAVAEAFAAYEESLEAHFKNGEILENDEFEKAQSKSIGAAYEIFRANVKGDIIAPYEKKLNGQIDEMFKRKKELNQKNSKVQCEAILEEIVSSIGAAIEGGKVHDMDQLQKIWDDSLDDKFEKKAKGPEKRSCLAAFLRRKPIEHSRKIMTKSVALLEQKHEEEIKKIKQDNEVEIGKVEKLYNNVLESWDRAKKDLREVEEENKQLIRSIAHLSEAL